MGNLQDTLIYDLFSKYQTSASVFRFRYGIYVALAIPVAYLALAAAAYFATAY